MTLSYLNGDKLDRKTTPALHQTKVLKPFGSQVLGHRVRQRESTTLVHADWDVAIGDPIGSQQKLIPEVQPDVGARLHAEASPRGLVE
jgi:hypothetical protein